MRNLVSLRRQLPRAGGLWVGLVLALLSGPCPFFLAAQDPPDLPIAGDCNRDESVDVGDVIRLLENLFHGRGALDCRLSCDANADGEIDIADPILLLQYLFVNPRSPPSRGDAMEVCDGVDNDCNGQVDEGCAPPEEGSLRLAWDPVTTNERGETIAIGGYRVYVGTSSGAYSRSLDAGPETTYTVDGLDVGRRYCFAVTAYDEAGNESAFSNEVCAVPGPP